MSARPESSSARTDTLLKRTEVKYQSGGMKVPTGETMPARGKDDLTEVGDDVYTAGNVVGEGVGDGSAPGRQPDGGANRCRGSQYENDLARRIKRAAASRPR
jgi:hypothetical protein